MPEPQINSNEITPTALYLLLDRLERTVANGFDGVNGRLDKLNGRVGSTEQDIAILKDRANHTEHRADAAKDRADEAVSTAQSSRGAAKWWGAGLASIVVTALELVRQFYGTGGK